MQNPRQAVTCRSGTILFVESRPDGIAHIYKRLLPSDHVRQHECTQKRNRRDTFSEGTAGPCGRAFLGAVPSIGPKKGIRKIRQYFSIPTTYGTESCPPVHGGEILKP